MFLLETPVWVLLAPFLLICGAAWLAAWRYRGTYDFKKSCRMYFPLGTTVILSFIFAGLPVAIGIFMVFFGFAAMMFVSNRLFYND